jgi:hypothetical protein
MTSGPNCSWSSPNRGIAPTEVLTTLWISRSCPGTQLLFAVEHLPNVVSGASNVGASPTWVVHRPSSSARAHLCLTRSSVSFCASDMRCRRNVPPHVRRCLRNLMRELGSKTLQLRQRASVLNPPPPQPLAPEAARPSVLHLTNPRKGPRCHEHRRAGRMSKKTKERYKRPPTP